MRHRRAAQYAPLVRFGDHYIADAVSALRKDVDARDQPPI